MYTNNQLTQTGRGRRTFSPEFKAKLVAACRIPGISVASVARNHAINHNILHRWLRELSDSAQPCIQFANARANRMKVLVHDGVG